VNVLCLAGSVRASTAPRISVTTCCGFGDSVITSTIYWS